MFGRKPAASEELRAVLRVQDQAEGRTPHVCVKTGQKTERAIEVRAADLGATSQMWERSIGSRSPTVGAALSDTMRVWLEPLSRQRKYMRDRKSVV